MESTSSGLDTCGSSASLIRSWGPWGNPETENCGGREQGGGNRSPRHIAGGRNSQANRDAKSGPLHRACPLRRNTAGVAPGCHGRQPHDYERPTRSEIASRLKLRRYEDVQREPQRSLSQRDNRQHEHGCKYAVAYIKLGGGAGRGQDQRGEKYGGTEPNRLQADVDAKGPEHVCRILQSGDEAPSAERQPRPYTDRAKPDPEVEQEGSQPGRSARYHGLVTLAQPPLSEQGDAA